MPQIDYTVPTALRAGPYYWEVQVPSTPSLWWRLGLMDDAPRVSISPTMEEVRGDNLGRGTVQDLVYQGAEATVDFVLNEFEMEAFQAVFPYWRKTAPAINNMENLGRGGLTVVGSIARQSTTASATYFMRATSIPDLPGSKPWRINFRQATLAPNFPLEFFLGSRLRNLPMRFLLLPYRIGTTTGLPTQFFDIEENNPSGLP